MSDFFDEDVSDDGAQKLGTKIKLRIQSFPSVQVFKQGRKTILRTWEIDFDVTEMEPSADT